MLVINHPGSFDIALVSGCHQVGIYEKRVDHVLIRQNGILAPRAAQQFHISSRVFSKFVLDQNGRKAFFFSK